MSFSDYLPNLNPLDLFKSREGHPFVQSLARNVAESQVGPAISGYTNQHILGDRPPADPNAANDTLNSPQNLALQQFLAKWLHPSQ